MHESLQTLLQARQSRTTIQTPPLRGGPRESLDTEDNPELMADFAFHDWRDPGDGESISDFKQRLKGNLYRIWNRMSRHTQKDGDSGSSCQSGDTWKGHGRKGSSNSRKSSQDQRILTTCSIRREPGAGQKAPRRPRTCG
jgi:hypothetical protein